MSISRLSHLSRQGRVVLQRSFMSTYNSNIDVGLFFIFTLHLSDKFQFKIGIKIDN